MAQITIDYGNIADNSIDLLHPDYIDIYKGSTTKNTYDVGFRPRYIILSMRNTSTANTNLGLVIINCENEKASARWMGDESETIDFDMSDTVVSDITDTGFSFQGQTTDYGYVFFVYK